MSYFKDGEFVELNLCASEGRHPGHHLVQQDPHGPIVHSAPMPQTQNHLWGELWWQETVWIMINKTFMFSNMGMLFELLCVSVCLIPLARGIRVCHTRCKTCQLDTRWGLWLNRSQSVSGTRGDRSSRSRASNRDTRCSVSREDGGYLGRRVIVR